MKIAAYCIAFILSFLLYFTPSSFAQSTVLNMNTDWAFYRGDLKDGYRQNLDDQKWIPVVIPHVMQLEKKHCGGNNIYQEVGWYRRYFKLNPEDKGKKVSIYFEGVMTSCVLFVNEQEVTKHFGGYIGFSCDITDYLNWDGDNVIAVRVSAEYDPLTPPGKPQGNMDFYYYSGIYRDVTLEITDKMHITHELEVDHTAGGGVFVSYPKVSKEEAIVSIKTHLMNGRNHGLKGELRSLLLDDKGKKIAEALTPISFTQGEDKHILQEITVKNPNLWHPYSPNRYQLKTQVCLDGKVIDEESRMIGIRTIKQTKEKGFFINGEHLYLRGANRHQAYANIGDAASNSMQERDVIDFKRGGYNAVRAAHYPQDPAFLDACDKYGLLVLECIPGWQYFNSDSIFVQRLYDVGRKMIRRDRNHPSIFLWEIALNESRYPKSLAEDLYKIAHDEYPGDQMYTSGDYLGHADMVDCYDVFYKQVSKYPKDGNVMSNFIEDFISVKPLYTREWGDGVGEKPRVSLCENEEEQMKQCRSRFTQLNGDGYFDWCMLDANECMGGHFMWSYNDYARGSQKETLYCGVVDINRWPKFSYYMLQSVRDAAISQKGLYEGPMVFIASYNSPEQLSSSITDITVFSNCDEVRLFRNSKLIGTQTRDERTPLYAPIVKKGGSPCFVFNAKNYEAGELRADAFIKGKKVATHKVTTAGKPQQIEVIIADKGVAPIADGSDMIPVYFKICDKDASLIYNSRQKIKIRVEGEGELIGEGIKRIAISEQEVEGGIGFAFIRTTKKAGKIKIIAEAEGLESGEATITTKKYKGELLSDGKHNSFNGNEEDNVVVSYEEDLTSIVERKKAIPIQSITVPSAHPSYPYSNITDGNPTTWWISQQEELPQSVLLTLPRISFVYASRIWFQKDSASYLHKVETSTDGKTWVLLYQKECTGWEFKPVLVNRDLKYFRLTFLGVSEGLAGLGEIVLY